MKTRVRFAPSPTGPLHIGGVRTALYNYLFAKKMGGDLILRIEDTDQNRFVEGAENYIVESFKWLGIVFDEGVHIGGQYGPYRQSERKPIYKEYADLLVNKGWAYYAFDTPEELDEKRKIMEGMKQTFQYDLHTRGTLCNSISLSEEEVQRRLAAGDHYVIRFKYPENLDIIVDDLIRGKVKINSNTLDDKVLYKSDGMPTYHLANIVDDHLMKITHVIRGEEWLPSAPLHLLLYQAFEWEAPRFAHLPLLLKPDGNGKLSKRDGDRLGFPVFPLQWTDPKTAEISSGYREAGYLPEAVINMLALLGWNPGTEQEVMSMDEMIELFSLEKISKAGAKFDLDKAKWFNHHYLQLKSIEELTDDFSKILLEKNISSPKDYVAKVVVLVKERIYFVKDLWTNSDYFFVKPESFDQQVIKKRWKDNTAPHLMQITQLIASVSPFDKTQAHDLVMQYIQDNELNMGQIMNCLRLALVGAAKGPDIFEIIDLIGVDEVVSRVNFAIQTIDK